MMQHRHALKWTTWTIWTLASGALVSLVHAEQPVALPKPIAHWRLDDTGTEAADSAGMHLGKISGAKSVAGKIGQALQFSGEGDHVAIPYAKDFELHTFSVAAWVKVTEDPTFSGVLGTRHGKDFTFDLKVNADKVHGDIGDGQRWIETKVNVYAGDGGANGRGGDLDLNRWYHLAWVIDTPHHECRLYIDGDLKKSLPFAGEPVLMQPGQEMHIGHSSGTEFMHGAIDDLRIYPTALSTAQVQQLAMPGP